MSAVFWSPPPPLRHNPVISPASPLTPSTILLQPPPPSSHLDPLLLLPARRANTTEGPCFEEGHDLCSDVYLAEGEWEEGGAAGVAAAAAGGREDGRRSALFNLRVVLNPFLTPDTGRLTRFNNRWMRRLKRWKTDILILTRTALYNDSE